MLGAVFLHSYYQIYDYETRSIGFNGDFIDFYPNRPKPNGEGSGASNFIIVLLVVLAVLAILGLGMFIRKKINDKRLENDLKSSQ